MKITQVKIGATIPVVQYGNISPELSIELDEDDSIDDAKRIALSHIQDVWKEYSEKKIGGAKRVTSETRLLVKDIFGNEIYYDDVVHEYTNTLGEVYLSGSKYAEQFERPFNASSISEMMALKHKLSTDDVQKIQDMWALKATASASFGTSIHAALELYGKYKELAMSMDKETHFHDNPVLRDAVSLFYAEHPEVSNTGYECLVVDHTMKRAGRIDRLEYETKKDVYITDFKTNFDVKKSLKKYWLQLSFYAAILKANGLNVKGLKIYHYDGKRWTTIPGDVVDIDNIK